MALTERLQILIESLGGSAVVGDFTKIGAAGKSEFERAAAAGNKAASDIEAAQKRMAITTEAAQAKILAANQRLEGAQLKAAQASTAVERAQTRLGESAAGTDAAAKAAERLEAAELRAAHASQTLEAAQSKAATVTSRANAGIADAETRLRGAERAADGLATSSAAAGRSLAEVGSGGGLSSVLEKLTTFGAPIPNQLLAIASAGAQVGAGGEQGSDGLGALANSATAATGALTIAREPAAGLASSLAGPLQVGALVAGAGLVKMSVDGVAAMVKVGAETRTLKAALGSTAEEASGLRNVAVGLGVDSDALAKGIVKLSGNLAQQKGEFAGVHVETARNADGSADLVGTIDNLRAAYQSIQDPQQRNIFLQEAMSKGGVELRGVLAANNAEFERLKSSGPSLNQEDLDRTLELAKAQRELTAAVQDLEIGMAKGIVPVLTTVERTLTTVVDVSAKLHIPIVEIGVASLAGAVGVRLLGRAFAAQAVEATAATAANAGAAVSMTAAGAAGAAAAPGVAAAGAATGVAAQKMGLLAIAGRLLGPIIGIQLGNEFNDLVGLHGQLGDKIDELSEKIPVLGTYFRHYNESNKSAAESTKENAEAAASAAADLDKFTVATEAATDAANKLAGARSSLVALQISDMGRTTATPGAEEGLATAEAHLVDVRAQGVEDMAKAKADYAASALSANERVLASETRLTEASVARAAKVADAEAKLADAQEAASQRVVDAQRAATEANASAHQSTRDAERGLSDLRANQAAAGNPALAAQLSRAQATQRAVEAVDRARSREGDVAQKGSDSVGKAQAEGIRSVAGAQEALDKARIEGAKSVAAAEREVGAARAEQNKVVAEGNGLAKLAEKHQRDIAAAVKDVGKAQADLARARETDAVAQAERDANAIKIALDIKGIKHDEKADNEILAQQYDVQAAKLAPDSPLRRNLQALADILRGGMALNVDTSAAEKSISALIAGATALQTRVNESGPGGGNRAALDAPPVDPLKAGVSASGPGGGRGASLAGRARGGLVSAGIAYTVGEEGPETLVMHPASGGYVIPNGGGRAGGGPVGTMSTAQFAATLRAGAGAGGDGIDYKRLGAEVAAALRVAGVGETNNLTFHGVQPGDLPSRLPREMRKQRFLAGYGR